MNSIFNCFKDYLSTNDLYCFKKSEELENSNQYYLSFFPKDIVDEIQKIADKKNLSFNKVVIEFLKFG